MQRVRKELGIVVLNDVQVQLEVGGIKGRSRILLFFRSPNAIMETRVAAGSGISLKVIGMPLQNGDIILVVGDGKERMRRAPQAFCRGLKPPFSLQKLA